MSKTMKEIEARAAAAGCSPEVLVMERKVALEELSKKLHDYMRPIARPEKQPAEGSPEDVLLGMTSGLRLASLHFLAMIDDLKLP